MASTMEMVHVLDAAHRIDSLEKWVTALVDLEDKVMCLRNHQIKLLQGGAFNKGRFEKWHKNGARYFQIMMFSGVVLCPYKVQRSKDDKL